MKKNIAFVISNLTGGGAQRVVSTLSSSLAAYYNIYIVLHDSNEVTYPYSGVIVDLKTPVSENIIIKLSSFIKRVMRLKAFKKRIKPYATISFMENSNFINLLTRDNGLQIISVRNFKSKQSKGFYGRLFKLLVKLLYNQSEQIVTPSMGIKNDLIESFNIKKEKITVINNPLDSAMIVQMAAEDMAGDETIFFKAPVLITVGSLIEQKGHRHLIHVFKRVKESRSDVKLLIIGEGYLKNSLQKYINSLGLTEQVKLAGFQHNPFKYISKSSLFILSSLYEGFSNVLLEAMACGIPVVSTDCQSGPREILAPGSGYQPMKNRVEFAEFGVLTPVFSSNFSKGGKTLLLAEELMATAILTLLKDNDQYDQYRLQGLKRVKDFSLENITEQWCSAIENKSLLRCNRE